MIAHGSWQQCCPERYVSGNGEKSGRYSLTTSDESRCPDGCLYLKQNSVNSFCFLKSHNYIASCSTETRMPPSTTTTTTTTTTMSLAQIWQQNKTLIRPRTIAESGVWGPDEFCDVGSYAIGYQLYEAPLCTRRCAADDDSALKGVRLICAEYPHTSSSAQTTVTSSVDEGCLMRRRGLTCQWGAVQTCSQPAFLTQSRYLSEYYHDITVTISGTELLNQCPPGIVCRNHTAIASDPVGGMNVDMRCSDGTEFSGDAISQAELPLVGGEETSEWSGWTSCPPDMAICGIRSKIHNGETDRQSNMGQTEVLFHCCQLPAAFFGKLK